MHGRQWTPPPLLPPPGVEPVDGGGVDGGQEALGAHAEGVAHGGAGEADVQVLDHLRANKRGQGDRESEQPRLLRSSALRLPGGPTAVQRAMQLPPLPRPPAG
jgi:hypothetical protein